jgi:16S rRNA (uracil1498-N3)-methyltransferase
VNSVLRASAAHVFVESLAAPHLTDADDHHLRKVLRIRETDAITLGDGVGGWVVARLTRDGVCVESEPLFEPAAPPSAVVSAIPKGDRPELIVQKATEIGVNTLIFMICARSVVHWDAARAQLQLVRLRRVAREAAMQSRRLWLPDVLDVVSFEEAAASPSCAIADPDGGDLGDEIDSVLVGPEGGFTESELNAVANRVSLSRNVLRVETAALTAAFLLTQRNQAT